METANYALVLTGELLAGGDADTVWPRLATWFRIDTERLTGRVLARAPLMIKQGTDQARLQSLEASIRAIGAEALTVDLDQRANLFVLIENHACGSLPYGFVEDRIRLGIWPADIEVAEAGSSDWKPWNRLACAPAADTAIAAEDAMAVAAADEAEAMDARDEVGAVAATDEAVVADAADEADAVDEAVATVEIAPTTEPPVQPESAPPFEAQHEPEAIIGSTQPVELEPALSAEAQMIESPGAELAVEEVGGDPPQDHVTVEDIAQDDAVAGGEPDGWIQPEAVPSEALQAEAQQSDAADEETSAGTADGGQSPEMADRQSWLPAETDDAAEPEAEDRERWWRRLARRLRPG